MAGTRVKPDKPYPAFPLYPHANGQWAKKIRGRRYYFGPWHDPQVAVNRYLDELPYLAAGRTPPVAGQGRTDGLTVGSLVRQFLDAKTAEQHSGKIVPRTLAGLRRAADEAGRILGSDRLVEDLTPADFGRLRQAWAGRVGADTLTAYLTRARGMFRWALTNRLIAAPVATGTYFEPPSRRQRRLARTARPEKCFAADQVRRILQADDDPRLRAATLLGLNAGFGNEDVASLRLSELDLTAGWFRKARSKTGTLRRGPLWPQTLALLKEIAAARTPQDPRDNRLLLDRTGRPLSTNAVGSRFTRLLRRLGLHQPGFGFYTCRHTFRTCAYNATGDERAIDVIMGHAADGDDMGAIYTARIDDARLVQVTQAVRTTLAIDTIAGLEPTL